MPQVCLDFRASGFKGAYAFTLCHATSACCERACRVRLHQCCMSTSPRLLQQVVVRCTEPAAVLSYFSKMLTVRQLRFVVFLYTHARMYSCDMCVGMVPLCCIHTFERGHGIGLFSSTINKRRFTHCQKGDLWRCHCTWRSFRNCNRRRRFRFPFVSHPSRLHLV